MADGDNDHCSDNPGHITAALCESYRAHIETKIGDMERRIRWSVYLSTTLLGIALAMLQYYLKVVVV